MRPNVMFHILLETVVKSSRQQDFGSESYHKKEVINFHSHDHAFGYHFVFQIGQ